MVSIYGHRLEAGKTVVAQAGKALEANDPKRLLGRGYSIVTTENGVLKQTSDVAAGDVANIRVSDGTIETKVTDTKKNTND
jgi:exonuclease VII large subunit